GELDFDNAYRRLAPWQAIRSGRVVVLPARRRFERGQWSSVPVTPLQQAGRPIRAVLDEAIAPYREELGRIPLYVSIDKDVLRGAAAAVNWDSGLRTLGEASTVVEPFRDAARGSLISPALLGDWSPTRLGGWLTRPCDRLDHPSPAHDPAEAAARNIR